MIRDYCGWHVAPLASSTTTHTVRRDKPFIVLDTLNLVSVDDLPFDGTAIADVGSTFTASGRIDPQGYWRPAPSNFTATYSHGYDTVPAPVTEVGYELASRAMEKSSSAYRNAEVGPYRVAFAEQLGAYLDGSQKGTAVTVRGAPGLERAWLVVSTWQCISHSDSRWTFARQHLAIVVM